LEEFYFRFRSRPFRRNRRVILHLAAEFWSELGPQIASSSISDMLNSSGDIAMYTFWRFGLKLPIHAPFN